MKVHLLSSLLLMNAVACTGGAVINTNGTAATSGTVTFQACNGESRSATISNGTFAINPAAAGSNGVYVPAGRSLVTFTQPAGRSYYAAIDHQYDQTCPYQGQNQPCKKYVFGLGIDPRPWAGNDLTPVYMNEIRRWEDVDLVSQINCLHFKPVKE